MAETVLNLTAMDAALKELYDGQSVMMMAYKDKPLLALMPKKTNFGGRKKPLPLLYGSNKLKAAERHRMAMDALKAVGLQDRSDHKPNQLSGGQQQRVAIARALITSPSILLADEPTGNLDTRTSIEVMGIFQRLNQERGLTIVLVTHEPDIAEYATRIVAFRDGRVRTDEQVTERRIAAVELAKLEAEAA